ADCSARWDSLARAVPRVGSSPAAHSQGDFPASRWVDSPGDSWLPAMALVSPAERSLHAVRMQADSPHASAAAVGAPPALPDFVAAPAVARQMMAAAVVERSSRSRDGSRPSAEERLPGLRCLRALPTLLVAREEPRPAS